MKNSEIFRNLLNELLIESPQYKSELKNFQEYLKDRMLEEKVFNLNVTHIDEYFVYSYDTKIGSIPSLTSHIAALKRLFDFLINRKFDFNTLYGYINTVGFKEKLSKQLEQSFQKPVINETLLNSILYRFDLYISDNINNKFKTKSEKNRFVNILISRLYAKLSLILPLKPNEMLELQLFDITDGLTRTIEHNGILIKIPNSLREQIIESIKFIERHYNKVYLDDDKLFYFLYNALDRTDISSSRISESFITTYKILGIDEMLKQKKVGKKIHYVYPPESYKITAILDMLNNGVNIVYLKKLTGLDIGTLVSNFNFENKPDLKDNVSIDINKGLMSTEYYVYL
ncbi:hypothetical protein KQI41_07280 [Tissierella pigra]|uniref:Uncharacterized protein n=1 Tax=Tissierella pigra TaxID=2607614 RepID=A0A6N7XUU7_9FIRM|nr:hypothetical protein [Tissierella pigra]MBU5426215.1 hypothetical protein [Tissierella pigra]MSU01213.1 hypothetical protein [Tissierella pigra]